MFDEALLVAAILRSRQAYETTHRVGLEPGDMSPAAAFLVRAADRQYRTDPTIKACDFRVLRAQIERAHGTGTVGRSMVDYLEALPADVSGVNVAEEHRLFRLSATATALASRLAAHQHDEATQDLLARYNRILEGETAEAVQWRLEPEDFTEDGAARIPLYPGSLNAYIGGGVLRGHNVTIYGRPDSGKSMFTINQAACAVYHGYKVLYVANEEPSQDITRRLLSRMTRCDLTELRDIATVRQAIDHVREEYERWFLLHRANLSVKDVTRMATQVKPDIIIIDQLKNLAIADDNRALQLDKVARQIRELGIELNCVTMSVTQAGDSAQNKLILGMGDIEWSNTGIPGAADLLIGIGVTDEYQGLRKRMISVPKNKINGKHGAFPVWVNPMQTAFLSKQGDADE